MKDDRKIKKLYPIYGNNWNTIASFLPGKTGEMVRNRFISDVDVESIDISTEEIVGIEGTSSNVSAIEIKLSK